MAKPAEITLDEKVALLAAIRAGKLRIGDPIKGGFVMLPAQDSTPPHKTE